MNSRNLKHEAEIFFESVRAILMRHWDPIGVQDEPAAYDEYDTYARAIVGMLLNGNYNPIAARDYLERIAIEWMSIRSSQESVDAAVAAITALDVRRQMLKDIFRGEDRGDGSSGSP